MFIWLKATVSIFGLPIAHWAIIVFCAGAIVEYILGRSKNPQYRSLAGTIFTGLNKLCVFCHVDQLPVIKQLLDALTPPTAAEEASTAIADIKAGAPSKSAAEKVAETSIKKP